MPAVKRDTGVKSNLLRKQGTWTEEIAVGGRQLIDIIQRLVAKGNVRRLLVMKNDGQVLLETSLTTGATVAGAFAILAPMLTALAALAALLTEVRVKIVYTGDPPRG
jgi:hypothetical protein